MNRVDAMQPTLTGDGVVLRIWRLDDRRALEVIVQRSSEAFGDWLPGVMSDLADLDDFLARVDRASRDRSAYLYAIEAGGEVVGQCSLHHRNAGTAEVGYWVRSDRTGRGIATGAVVVVAEAAFSAGVGELVILCDEGNTRSASVARRAGFVHASTVDLDPTLSRTRAQTGREMCWSQRNPGG